MLQFAGDWDQALRAYPENQAYLDVFTQDQVTQAIKNKVGAPGSIGIFANKAINDANHTITIEQGPHQPEDTSGGGFTLHVTPLWDNGFDAKRLHLYLRQDNSGNLIIAKLTGTFPRQRQRHYRFH